MKDDDRARAPFTVLIVCTANQCRSPMAEILLRDAARARGLDWVVRSAGTRAVEGRPMDPKARAVLVERGHDPGGWTSMPLTPQLVEEADLVLTAEALHRSEVVTLVPAALTHSFLLLQFARLAGHSRPVAQPRGPKSGQLLVEAVTEARAHVQPVPPGSDDIEDPVGRRKRAFRACADVLEAAVEALLDPLRVED